MSRLYNSPNGPASLSKGDFFRTKYDHENKSIHCYIFSQYLPSGKIYACTELCSSLVVLDPKEIYMIYPLDPKDRKDAINALTS